MSVKSAIMQAKISGVLTDIFVKTGVENVVLTDGNTEVTLSSKLAEIIAGLNERAKKTDVTTEISNAIDGLIGGAPSTYDTLKEIADYITQHEDVVTAINSAIGNKVDKVSGKGLSANDFTDALKAKVEALGALASKNKVGEADLDTVLAQKINAASEGNHTHANKAILDTITSEKVSDWDTAAHLYVQSSEPVTLGEGDLFLKLVE